MNARNLHIHESEGKRIPDICGTAIDLITGAHSKRISLATLYIDAGKSSVPHYHKVTEEIYYFIEGAGRVLIGGDVFTVRPGSAVYIPLLKVHQIINDSPGQLKFVSADSPPYDPADVYQKPD